jgi:hypothetical protein
MFNDLICKDTINECILESSEKLLFTLLSQEINFSIFCYINNVKFNPPIPDNIGANMKSLTIFALSGYTLTTVEIDKNKIVFEAGFGEENFASTVTVPIANILQILIGENVIFVNPFSDGLSSTQKKEKGEEELSVSMQAILSNPKNKNIFKK